MTAMPKDTEFAAHSEWLSRARSTAKALARQLGAITSDDLWEHCPPPPGSDPRVMGAVFQPRSEWEKVDWRPSWRRDVNHGRNVAIWNLRYPS